jgi:hypothetical protein
MMRRIRRRRKSENTCVLTTEEGRALIPAPAEFVNSHEKFGGGQFKLAFSCRCDWPMIVGNDSMCHSEDNAIAASTQYMSARAEFVPRYRRKGYRFGTIIPNLPRNLQHYETQSRDRLPSS